MPVEAAGIGALLNFDGHKVGAFKVRKVQSGIAVRSRRKLHFSAKFALFIGKRDRNHETRNIGSSAVQANEETAGPLSSRITGDRVECAAAAYGSNGK